MPSPTHQRLKIRSLWKEVLKSWGGKVALSKQMSPFQIPQQAHPVAHDTEAKRGCLLASELHIVNRGEKNPCPISISGTGELITRSQQKISGFLQTQVTIIKIKENKNRTRMQTFQSKNAVCEMLPAQRLPAVQNTTSQDSGNPTKTTNYEH